MYTVRLRRILEARHFLSGGDFGDEGRRHGHRYEVTVQMEGSVLDGHGFLVDITLAEKIVDRLLAHYRGRTLNVLAEFKGINPSIEHFARVICLGVCRRLDAPNVHAVTVRVAEHENASASYRSYIDAHRTRYL